MPANEVCSSCKNTLTLNHREHRETQGNCSALEKISVLLCSSVPLFSCVLCGKDFPTQPRSQRTFLPQPRTIFRRTYHVIAFLLWCFLFIACWPLALLALIIYPIVWLLLLPFRLVGIAVHGALALVWAAVMLPARLLSAPFRLSRI
jgi:hypothetical protein